MVLLCIGVLAGAAWAGAAPLQVDADLPAGNIVVEKIAGDDVYLHPDLRDTAGDWFYWCFRVREAQNRTLTFHFTRGNHIGVRGPAVSTDGGRAWQWLGTEAVHSNTFSCSFGAQEGGVRFCVAFPYTEANLAAFLAGHAGDPHLKVATLCRTEHGRDAELLRVGRLDGRAEQTVLLTCRHHCCEMMASYVLEGLVAGVLADTAEGRWLREHVEFFVVPFVDKDGVEAGDQGKNRQPHDHNRDYSGPGRYATVRAIREQVPRWSAGRLRLALDLHCPTLRGGRNEQIHFVGGPDARTWHGTERLAQLLEATQTGPLAFHGRDNLPFGQEWNTPANYRSGTSCSQWAAALPGVRAAASLETPYANAHGTAVTEQSARALGGDLVRAIQRYLATETAGRPDL